MSQVSTVFHVSIYALVSVASLMLAFAEGGALPQALTLPLAILAFFLVERGQVFAIPTLLANTLGLVAFVAAGWEFFSEDIEGRILAGAHLLVYLTWIVLFQQKRIVQYWWMCALGVLQVAVGSVLTNDESYGGMLIGYMSFSIWTLSVFSLHQAQLQFGAAASHGDRDADAAREAARPQDARRLESGSRALAGWLRRPSVARGAIQHDPNERWLGAQFLLTNLGTAVLAMVVASFFFLLIPRLWAGRTDWPTGKAETGQREVSGFSPMVRLGDFGDILESTEKVLEIRVFDNNDSRELDVEQYAASIGMAEPLFRGTILIDYQNGIWTGADRNVLRMHELTSRTSKEMIRQEILLQPIGTDVLFAMQPISAGRISGRTDDIELQRSMGVLYRPKNVPVQRALGYFIYSPAPDVSRTTAGVVPSLTPSIPGARYEFDRLKEICRTKPGRRLARLSELAHKVSGYDSPEKPTPRILADRIHAYLRNSGEFSYSLDTSIQDESIDPIEDFLFNRKQGHCKYFATALALMLRAVDVPARLVSGFKGGSINAISGHFEVEQRHAHAWVEAFVRDGGEGHWVTLDATPEAREESVQSFAPSMQTAHDLASFVKGSWSRYVVNMDFSQQTSNFYDPLLQWWRKWWYANDGGRARLSDWWSEFVAMIKDPSRWFSFQGASITFVLLFLAVGLFRIARRSAWFWRLFSRFWRRDYDARRMRIAFYERFENLCTSLGLVRGRAQTQREFGEVVRQRLERFPTDGPLGNIPAAVVSSFYRVRFGMLDLDVDEADLLDRQLSQLEKSIVAANTRR